MKIIIVGGGCAGLTAAQHLIAAGYENISVLEKNPRAGGRMITYHKNGFHVDLAAQLVHPGYKSAKALIHDMGMDEDLVVTSLGGSQFFNGHRINRLAPCGIPEEDAKNAEWMAEMGEDNFRRFVSFVSERCKGKMYEGSVDWFLDLDDKGNFADFVSENFGSGVLQNFVEPIIGAIALAHPREIGIGFGLQIMWTVLCGEASMLAHGLGSLAEAIISKLGNKVHTNTEVTEIVIENGKAIGVRTNEGFEPADAVICAVTANHALEILPNITEAMKAALSKVTYSPAMTTLIFLDNSKLDAKKVGLFFRQDLGAPFGAFSFKSVRSPNSVPPGKDCISTFVYGDRCRELWNEDDATVAEAVIKSVEMAYPSIRNAVVGHHVARFKEANYIMESGCCTAIKDFRDNHYQDIKNLYLCGEYMYTGSYESAIFAGKNAACVLMEDTLLV